MRSSASFRSSRELANLPNRDTPAANGAIRHAHARQYTHPPESPANDTPLIGERAAPRGCSAAEGGDEPGNRRLSVRAPALLGATTTCPRGGVIDARRPRGQTIGALDSACLEGDSADTVVGRAPDGGKAGARCGNTSAATTRTVSRFRTDTRRDSTRPGTRTAVDDLLRRQPRRAAHRRTRRKARTANNGTPARRTTRRGTRTRGDELRRDVG